MKLTLLFVNCKWKLKKEIKSYLSCSILESAAVRSEMKVVLRCENDFQVDALTVVDFTMLNVVCHAIVMIVLRFIVGY